MIMLMDCQVLHCCY